MQYLNTGAYVEGERAPSKKALREAVKAHPESVRFDLTSQFDGQGDWTPEDVGPGVTLSVVGPDPYTSRRWYASVTRDAKGVLVVS